MNKQFIIKIIVFVFLFLSVNVHAQCSEIVSGNQLNWKNNKLTIENEAISMKLQKTSMGISLVEVTNKQLVETIHFKTGSQLFRLGNLTDSVLSVKLSVKKLPETASTHPGTLYVANLEYDKVDVRIQWRMFTNSPMIPFRFYVKRKSDAIAFNPDETHLIHLNLHSRHWLMQSAEFIDWTDYYNTFVQEHEGISYIYPTKLRGNVLWAKDLMNEHSLVFIKEATGTSVQLHSPGYDFYSHNDRLSVAGAGIAPSDLPKNEWVRTYGAAIGVTGMEEMDYLKTLRRYQKYWRKIVPERDEMIMMNTWGDRSADANIGEEFLRREVDACEKLNITHFQIDDGWQSGRSTGSASGTGTLWDEWSYDDWQPDNGRFPSGMQEIKKYAGSKGVKLGLWFHPSNENEYAKWKQDVDILTGLYNDYGIQYFKIDGVKLKTKKSEIYFRKILDEVSRNTDYNVVFNLDVTHDERAGYFDFYEYGNIFLENRYTDWGGYYPYWTLRNLWQLSKFVPAERFQIEFLNNQRNKDKYPADDIFAPGNLSMEYTFAVTLMAQPLAWLEGSNLPAKSLRIAPLIEQYKKVQAELHSGLIFPIGEEPSGRAWTGFQSILDENSGYVLVFRENNEKPSATIKLLEANGNTFKFEKVLGDGKSFQQQVGENGFVDFHLPAINNFVLYKYSAE